MRYMLDTNICIYSIKHKPEQVLLRLQEHDPSDICISSVTYAELMHGVEKSQAVEKNRLAFVRWYSAAFLLQSCQSAEKCFYLFR